VAASEDAAFTAALKRAKALLTCGFVPQVPTVATAAVTEPPSTDEEKPPWRALERVPLRQSRRHKPS
jgi:hypothetical protein